MGNSVAMIEKHYGHLEVDPGRMRQLLTDFSASQRSSGQPHPVATAPREGEKTESRMADAAGAAPSA